MELEMVQIMCRKSLDRLTPEQALEQFRRKGARLMREQVRARLENQATDSSSKEVKREPWNC
jgi:hypothetical protein